MIYQAIEVRHKASEPYARAVFYGHEDAPAIAIRQRPVVVICPGGGYEHTSDREADIVALQFLAHGYHATVLRYSCAPAVYPTALLELAATVRTLREHAAAWHIDPARVYVMGFSAGGHLAASYSAFWRERFIAEALGCDTDSLEPNGQLLCYPVITAGEYAHAGSFHCLLGADYAEKKDELSLEKRVNEAIPRTFLWHTYTDDTVPVQNSLLYMNALAAVGIPLEAHIFARGGHGLSLGNRLSAGENDREIEPIVQPWIALACAWIGEV